MPGGNILIVEDEYLIAEVIKTRLESSGYLVPAIVSSGSEAVKKAMNLAPDLILMDIVLKGDMDGVQAAERIRSHQDVPIIFITAHTDEETLRRAKVTGPFGYLTKPINDRQLIINIEIALYRHRYERERTELIRRLEKEISERRSAEERLRESEELYRVLVNSSPDVILRFDRECRHVFANSIVEKYSPLPADGMLGRTHKELGFPDDMCDFWEKSIRSVFDTGEPLEQQFELEMEGNTIVFDWRLLPEFGADGGVNSVMSVSRDITELRRIEDERNRADRLESIGTLAGGIAHDYNNLLAAILGNIALVKMNTEEGSEDHMSLDEAEQAAFRARDLTRQFLTFSKGGAPVRTPMRVDSLVRDAVSVSLKETNVSVEFDVDDGLMMAEIDGGQIAQAVSAVVRNAVEAMPGGGRITVRMKNASTGDLPSVPLAPGPYVVVSITDTGPGIDPKVLPGIFDPYCSTKKGAAGLGLTTAYSIAARHGGVITAESEPDSGCTIHIHLPALPSGDEKAAGDRPVTTFDRPFGDILVMDDEAAVRRVVARMLESFGCSVATAADGGEAVSRYRERFDAGNPFDAVIMDLTVPGGMGGSEAVRRIREFDPGVCAIVATGYSNDPVVGQYKTYGFSGYILKPFRPDDLKKLISGTSPEE